MTEQDRLVACFFLPVPLKFVDRTKLKTIADSILTFSQASPGLQYKSFENTLGKGEIACNDQFLLCPQRFPPFTRTFCHFHPIRNCRLLTL